MTPGDRVHSVLQREHRDSLRLARWTYVSAITLTSASTRQTLVLHVYSIASRLTVISTFASPLSLIYFVCIAHMIQP
jgi:hypothetical protein